MKVLHIVSGIDPKSGGPTRSITGLCRGLVQEGVEAHLFVASPVHELREPSGVFFHKGRGESFALAREDIELVIQQVKPDIIHIHGLWVMVNHAATQRALKYNIPFIQAPRGMLEPWSLQQKKWKKTLALWLYQRKDIERATALHATASSEAEQFRILGFKQSIIISPNGVTFPDSMPSRSKRSDGKKVFLFISRIHPKKGLIELVEAWGEVKRQLAVGSRQSAVGGQRSDDATVATNELMNYRTNELLNWHVEYAGPDYDGHLEIVQKRIKTLDLEGDFTYLGNLDDQEKWVAYRRADIFVLPTYSENFGIVVAEALYAKVPVITTKGTPWAELHGVLESTGQQASLGSFTLPGKSEDGDQETTNELAETGRCGWWLDIGVESLVQALREAMKMGDEDRQVMGENGRRLVESKYTWPAVAKEMKLAYEWMLQCGKKPECVRVV
jgi:glycosyltransferase involved in cell wall biosynthesis